MAKTKTSGSKFKKVKQEYFHINFSKENYIILGIGLLLIIIGYIFMSENSVNGFLPTVVAPILLVLGYCVIIPVGLLYRKKSEDKVSEVKTSS